MEIVLNIAWAVSSLGLILLWARHADSNPVSRRTQVLALAMVVLLLLPVISLSDDLMAMQGPTETDTCLRRQLNSADLHPAFASACWAMPASIFAALGVTAFAQDLLQSDPWVAKADDLPRSLESRPPPQA